VLQAVEYLNEKNPGRKTILVFSDLEEDLQEGYVRDIPLTMDGFEGPIRTTGPCGQSPVGRRCDLRSQSLPCSP
jgi:hypothetical protein